MQKDRGNYRVVIENFRNVRRSARDHDIGTTMHTLPFPASPLFPLIKFNLALCRGGSSDTEAADMCEPII